MTPDNQDKQTDEYITESKELRRIVAETHKNVMLLQQDIQNLCGIIKTVENPGLKSPECSVCDEPAEEMDYED